MACDKPLSLIYCTSTSIFFKRLVQPKNLVIFSNISSKAGSWENWQQKNGICCIRIVLHPWKQTCPLKNDAKGRSDSFLCDMVPFRGLHSFFSGLVYILMIWCSFQPRHLCGQKLQNLPSEFPWKKHMLVGGIGHGAIDKTSGFRYFWNFHPYNLVKIPVLINIFQLGWNHQPDNVW